MVTRIKGTILGQSGTAQEMLAKVPGMTLKGEDLEVLGKGTPVFYINGRKIQDKDELKRLRSEEIQSVEVITNPGAEYDATISAVVRIKTVRREGTGFGFDLMAANNQDLTFGFSDPSSTLNLRYRHNISDPTPDPSPTRAGSSAAFPSHQGEGLGVGSVTDSTEIWRKGAMRRGYCLRNLGI